MNNIKFNLLNIDVNIEVIIIILSIPLMISMTGCFTSSKVSYFTIELTPLPGESTRNKDICLEVTSVKLAEPLKRKEIMFRKSPVEIGYYSEYLWASTLEEMLTVRINQYFLCDETKSKPDYYIHIDLLNFEQEFLKDTSYARVSMKVELINPEDMKIKFQRYYSETAPINSKNIVDIVSAISRATDNILLKLEKDITNYSRGT